ncbi:MAG: hypothetical protein NDI77_13815 [Geobacteraceae bacterium]|nr:hypothetical protein [Geobacteraceae bacterium]
MKTVFFEALFVYIFAFSHSPVQKMKSGQKFTLNKKAVTARGYEAFMMQWGSGTLNFFCPDRIMITDIKIIYAPICNDIGWLKGC